MVDLRVLGQLEMEAIGARDSCVAKVATRCADRPDPSLRNGGLLRMTAKLAAYVYERGLRSACSTTMPLIPKQVTAASATP